MLLSVDAYNDLGFLAYDKELGISHLLTRNELAAHLRRYVETFNLNMINSAEVQSTQYDVLKQRWKVTFQTQTGMHTAVSKQLVLATGIGSQKPKIPNLGDSHLYQGISIHSTQYKNAQQLKESGAKVRCH